eukprot:10666.XXX_583933_583015_1 [CDS] Oithona nana genome sequencing.
MPASNVFNQIVSKFDQLKKAWEGKKLPETEKLLLELKIAFACNFGHEHESNEKELLLIREVYEIGAQHSVAVKEVASFERYMSMLKSMYTDQSTTLPESSRMYELLGLNLLCLLSQNRLGDFHTELELLPPDVLLSNPYIENPVQLEQFIMEGKYNKVIDIRYNVPADSYKFFIDVLLVTIREEIASCMEKAYADIDVEECRKMLHLEKGELDKFVSDRNWSVDKKSKKIQFLHQEKKPSQEMEVPSRELAAMAISYAKEMEKIV